jgi:hypothetical protein
LDAYIFARVATTQAASDVLDSVSSSGPARVALPVTPDATGGRIVYVAVEGSTVLQLASRVAQILLIPGLGGSETYIPAPGATQPGIGFPTHVAVDVVVGLALLVCTDAEASAADVALISGVVGVVVVAGAGPNVIVEATGASTSAVNTILSSVGAVTGVLSIDTSVGATANGRGFTSI